MRVWEVGVSPAPILPVMNRHIMPLIVAALLSACGFVPDPTPDPLPTEDEAIAFMRDLVALAQAGDLVGMCELAGSMCESFVDESGGPAAVPDEPPVLAGTRVIPGTSEGDGGTIGGMLLVICGTDGLQRPYRTEMLVSRFMGEMFAINGVYWSGNNLAISNNTGGPSGGLGIDCP
jgi:hypothetical protein